MNRTNQWLFHIQESNMDHVIHTYNVTIPNIPEEELLITGMVWTRLVIGQDE